MSAQATANERIDFKHLDISDTRVTIDAEFGGESYPLYFQFDRAIPTTPTLVALALSTLCGLAYDEIAFDFEVDGPAVEAIELFTKARVAPFSKSTREVEPLKRGNVLSFSGGFDSMAAYALMPADTHLVSLDFGGWFQREADFFKKFDTLNIETNVRRTPSQQNALARNHWSFMAIGAILSARYFNAQYHTFGSILGETFANEHLSEQNKLSLLDYLGLVDAAYVSGITEIGTAAITMQKFGGLVGESLNSLAGKADRKRYLKIAISHLVDEKLNLGVELPPLPSEWNRKVEFTNSYTTALGALFFIANDRTEMIEPLFTKIPEAVLELGTQVSMDFHLKTNVDYYESFPQDLQHDLVGKLQAYGFRPYSSLDWREVSKVRSQLNAL